MAFTPKGSVQVWRLVKERHIETAFDGEGARLYGGRWNSAGLPMVYTSASLALATLETLVHLDPAGPVPRFVAFGVWVLPSQVETLPLDDPAGVTRYSLSHSRAIGDRWLKSGRCIGLWVPSAVVPFEQNLLLNPLHPDFERLELSDPIPFPFDPRLRTATR